jgi:hypothetical protein
MDFPDEKQDPDFGTEPAPTGDGMLGQGRRFRDVSEAQAYFDRLLTIRDLCSRFRVTEMTIQAWRRQQQLPTIVIPGTARPTVRFDPDLVQEWARARGKMMYH